MLKKTLATVITAAALFTAAILPAAAAPSPSTETVGTPVTGQKSSTAVKGVSSEEEYAEETSSSSVGIIIKKTDAATIQSAIAKVQNELNDVAALGAKLGNGALSAAAGDAGKVVTADVLSVVEITAGPDAVKNDDGSYTVTLNVPGVKAGDSVLILHYHMGYWQEIIPVSVGNGTVTAVFKSFSPVAVVKFSADGGVVAPQTGSNAPYVLICIASAGLLGAVYCGKRYLGR